MGSDDWAPSAEDLHWQSEYERLQEELKHSEGRKARIRWDDLMRSYATWLGNAEQLIGVLHVGETDESVITELVQNVRDRTPRALFLAEVDRHLLGALGSAVALVDQTRRVMRNYTGTPFAAEFATRNQAVAAVPSNAFLRDLRNYLQHYGQAPYNLRGKLVPVMTAEIGLDPTTLLEWEKWSSASKQFIRDQEGDVRLLPIVTLYVAAMVQLYQWTADQFEPLHKDDIDAANELVSQITYAQTGGLFSNPDEVRERMRTIVEGHLAKERNAPETD